jgi:hypothetical protein
MITRCSNISAAVAAIPSQDAIQEINKTRRTSTHTPRRMIVAKILAMKTAVFSMMIAQTAFQMGLASRNTQSHIRPRLLTLAPNLAQV